MSSKIVVSVEKEEFGVLKVELVKIWEKPSTYFEYSVVISTKDCVSKNGISIYNGVNFEYGNRRIVARFVFRSIVNVLKMAHKLSY